MVKHMSLDDADQEAIDLCRSYANSGVAAFLIRTTSDDSLRIIGPQLTGKAVGKMLRDAADAYEAQVEDDPIN